ncbi:MAG: Fic family protein [Cyanobacteria bacterium]|nr:Fic family protein [Cyanobacteriota bacterium]
MQRTLRQQEIVEIIAELNSASISQIRERLTQELSIPTLNRELANLVTNKYLEKIGKGRGTQYRITPYYQLFATIHTETYFEREPDDRKASVKFNVKVLTLLEQEPLFTPSEQTLLEALKKTYQNNISDYPKTLYQKELERLTIELSWKSSQIEGNTYSLLETERLFKEKEAVQGKPKEEATMLLNHKDALDYVLAHPNMATTLNLKVIEEIHALLIKDLGVGRNLRTRIVGITGTAYKPLGNPYQIREAIESMCHIINAKDNWFEKAMLAVVLISYIQPFEDGNKRTARMISNALLIAGSACPLSYRSVDSIEYKKAMLLFYEQNSLSAFKNIFLEQVAFSVKNYFQ